MRRINVIGTSGSGKSTFARTLANKLNYPHIEMDAIFWQKNWRQLDDKEFFQKLENTLNKEVWVLDGNYTRTLSIKWRQIDTIIWIDFSFTRTLYQAISRAISRIIDKKELWPNTSNRESLNMLFSKNSIVLWTLKTYLKNKRKNASFITDPNWSHLKFIRLTSPKHCEQFLNG